MDFDFLEWDDEGDPGNTRHIGEHGVTREEVEEVLEAASERDILPSRSSGRPAVIGETRAGRTLFVVFERDDNQGRFIVIRPVTAYDYEE